jgi:hypothetical protein
MDPRKIILLVSSAPPFELERVIYHDDRPYRQALEEVRFQSVSMPELEPYADAGGGLATAALPASGGNNVSATPGAAMGSSQATKASAEPSLDVIERQADKPTHQLCRLRGSLNRSMLGVLIIANWPMTAEFQVRQLPPQEAYRLRLP